MTDFKKVISRSNRAERQALLRAGTPLLYAHWEGFTKGAAIAYGSYLSGLGLRYEEILESFQGLEAISEVRQLAELKKRIFASSTILSKLRTIPSKSVKLPLTDYIGNVGNLNFELFSEVSSFVGVSIQGIETKKALIDVSLLKNRNDVAHGEFVQIDETEFSTLLDEIFDIMSAFKTEIQNSVAQKGFMRAPVAPIAVAGAVAPA
jgi:hypothetical protein